MGYFYLYLSIFSSVVIANLLKYYEKSGYSSSKTLFLGNYLIACIFSAGMSGFKIEPTGLDLLITSASGLFFLAGFIIFIVNIRENGMAVSTSTFRVSYIIPVALSVFLFKENVNIFNYFGIAAIIISFLILGIKNKNIIFNAESVQENMAGRKDLFMFNPLSRKLEGIFIEKAGKEDIYISPLMLFPSRWTFKYFSSVTASGFKARSAKVGRLIP